MRKLQLQFCDCERVFVCDDNGNSNGNDYNDSNNNNSHRARSVAMLPEHVYSLIHVSMTVVGLFQCVWLPFLTIGMWECVRALAYVSMY